MSDKQKKFHDVALRSILFKGRSDWYFCFLKAERIAHVLAVLADSAPESARPVLDSLTDLAAELPGTLAHFVAGEVDAAVVLADILTLLSAVRLAATRKNLSQDTGLIVAAECEALAERFAGSIHLSPFASADDFVIPELPPAGTEPLLPSQPTNIRASKPIKDIKDTQGRTAEILDFVLKNKGVSIKEVAAVVRGCSEKTIQRELGLLIERGLIRKVGERRWSQYLPL